MPSGRAALRLLTRVAILAAAASCAAPREEQSLGPYRSMLEVIAELRLARDADVYRFDPPQDVTGENVYRASLRRLENFETLLNDPRFRPVLRFAQAECRERLADFPGAAALYDEVARRPGDDPELAIRARALLPLVSELARLAAPLDESTARTPSSLDAALEARRAELEALLDRHAGDPRLDLVRVQIERLDVRQREYLWRIRALSADGAERAIAAAQAVVARHPESRRIHEHRLRLADAYAELARAYVSAVDPADAAFDAARARNLIQAAGRVYAEVAAVDGVVEREEARAGLGALEALLDRIGNTGP